LIPCIGSKQSQTSARPTIPTREKEIGVDTNLDDDLAELPLDRPKSEVSVLLIVDVDPDPVVVLDDVDLLLSDFQLPVTDDRPLDVVQRKLELYTIKE
jgi:hypothetical protein